MKKILVPVDFSEYAMNAYEFACDIAYHAQGEIKLVHVIDHPAFTSFNTTGEVRFDNMTDPYMIGLVKNVKTDLEKLSFNKNFPDLKITYEVKIGNPYENIAKVIDEIAADLVVMGTKGASGLRELFIGSNAEKVVRFSSCPVITVPTKVEFDNIKNIVYGVTLKEDHEGVIMELKQYIELFKAHLDLVWIDTPHENRNIEEAKKIINNFAKKQFLSDYSVNVYKAIYPDEGLLFYAEEQGSDMIAMATHSRKGLAHVFAGSLAEDVVNHAKRPVWTFSLKRKKI